MNRRSILIGIALTGFATAATAQGMLPPGVKDPGKDLYADFCWFGTACETHRLLVWGQFICDGATAKIEARRDYIVEGYVPPGKTYSGWRCGPAGDLHDVDDYSIVGWPGLSVGDPDLLPPLEGTPGVTVSVRNGP